MNLLLKSKITTPRIVEKYISERKYKELISMSKKWLKFKKFRKDKKFDLKQGDGWLTMNERESMLDCFTDILFYEKDHLDKS